MRTTACLVTLAALLGAALAQQLPPGSFPMPPLLYPTDSIVTLSNPLVYLQPPVPFPPITTPVCSSNWLNPPPIFYQYQVPVMVGPNGAGVIMSSNYTLAPFSAPVMSIDDLYIPVRTPVASYCDTRGRCIEGYEIQANIVTLDSGFTDPVTGRPLPGQWLAYDGAVPGHQFVIKQGVQSLVRLRNMIHCDPTTYTPIDPHNPNYSGYFWSEIYGITLHLHGGASLAPFDGWAREYIQSCQWKDYIYANEVPNDADWYHDHTFMLTADTVGGGLVGPYYVTSCKSEHVPPNLRQFGPPQPIIIGDQNFIRYGNYMQPAESHTNVVRPNNVWNNVSRPTTPLSGDHNLVNGHIWPTIRVQRKAYYWTFYSASPLRVYNLFFYNTTSNTTMNSKPGFFHIVGSDAGLRSSPAMAENGLLMGAGERYTVVVDFSKFKVGETILLVNLPDNFLFYYPVYCYSHLIMKIIIDGTEPAAQPWNSLYNHDIYFQGSGEEQGAESIAEACGRAMDNAGWNADVRVMATVTTGDLGGGRSTDVLLFANPTADPLQRPWRAGMWDPNLIPGPKSGRRSSLEVEHQDPPFFFSDTRTTIIPKALPRSATEEELAEIIGNKAAARSVWNRRSRRSALSQIGGRRSLNQAASSQQFPDSLPEVNPTNGWTTWYFYNNGTGRGAGGVHPMHMHLVDFLICGRRNNVSGYGTRDYEMNVPKDVFYMQTEDEVSIIFRSGPSQGAYMFHCHNLQHEDRGMMALFNNTGINNPLVNDRQTYWNGTTDSNRFYGYEQVPQDPLLYTRDDDPLVRPDGPIIGHNLYYSDSMPPSHMREDPDNPGHPQPITRDLLRRVVARNYYAVFYPDNRRNLATPVPSLPWACVCDA